MPHLVYFIPTSGYSASEKQRRLALMRQYLDPSFTIDFLTLEGTPEFLDRAHDFDTAIAAARAAIGSIGPEVGDVVVSGGAIDPGIPEIRAAARVPLVAPGELGLFTATLLGKRLSIVTVDEHAVARAREFVGRTATRPEVVSIRSMAAPVRAIMRDLETGRAALVREVRAAVLEDGADVVYLGSMTLGTLGVTDELRASLRVPIIDPLPLALRMAQEVARTRVAPAAPRA
jgi:Asp/Glu/hydantoin racemase